MDSYKCINRVCRTTLIVLFILQLVSTLERQVFDFLGYMWAPIIGNFFQIILVVVGIFGACNVYRSLVIVYATWSLLWFGWNIFVICLYLEVGILNRNRERYILTIGTEGKSWWLEHGIGCEVTNSTWEDSEFYDGGRNNPPESYVVGCLLQYYYVEVIHAAVQCLLSLLAFVASCICIYFLMEDDEDSMRSALDELEFVKMRYQSPSHLSPYHEDMAFENYNLTTEALPPASSSPSKPTSYQERDILPGYETTMRNKKATTTASNYFADDRQNVRRKASIGTKSSTNRLPDSSSSSITYAKPGKYLSRAHNTPSSDTESYLFRNYP